MASACAAAAASGVSLTERGISGPLVLATATGHHGGALPESVRSSTPGTSTAFYMAMRQSKAIRVALLAQGMPEESRFSLALDASKPGERIIKGRLSEPHALIRAHGVRGCAIIRITRPKPAEATAHKTATPVAAP